MRKTRKTRLESSSSSSSSSQSSKMQRLVPISGKEKSKLAKQQQKDNMTKSIAAMSKAAIRVDKAPTRYADVIATNEANVKATQKDRAANRQRLEALQSEADAQAIVDVREFAELAEYMDGSKGAGQVVTDTARPKTSPTIHEVNEDGNQSGNQTPNEEDY